MIADVPSAGQIMADIEWPDEVEQRSPILGRHSQNRVATDLAGRHVQDFPLRARRPIDGRIVSI